MDLRGLGYIGISVRDLPAWRSYGELLGAMVVDEGPGLRLRIDERPFRVLIDDGADELAFVGWELVGLCSYAYLWFNVVVLNERVERKHAEVEQLKKNASEVDALLDDIADYKEREKAIISIKTNRILWSRKLALPTDG